MAERSYSDEELARAVADSHSWRAVLRGLGLAATSSTAIRSVRRNAERMGLDTTHFTGQRRWTERQLAEAIARSETWTQVQGVLGLSGGSSTALLKGHAARLGIDASHLGRTPAPLPPGLAPMHAGLEHLPKAGSSMAAAWLILCGYEVAWPLEPCRYDLLARRLDQFLRVQVKTTRLRTGTSWIVSLSTDGGRLTYDPDEIDYFFIIDGGLDYYLIPVATVGGLRAIRLSVYSQFKLSQELSVLSAPEQSSETP
jgi:hypothetical protein